MLLFKILKFELIFLHIWLRDAIKKNRKLWGFCPKFIDPLPSPPNWDKQKLDLFAKLLDPLPHLGIWDITVTKLGSGNHIEDIFNSS